MLHQPEFAAGTDRKDGYFNPRCPICGTAGEFWCEKNSYVVDRCPACRFAYVRNIPPEAALAEFYGNYYGDTQEFIPLTQRYLSKLITKTLENAWHARVIAHHAKSRRRLLEVGCGEGYLLSALSKCGKFEAEGVDYASGAMSYLQSKGLHVQQGSIFDQRYPDGRFDFIVGFHVLEHVQDLDTFMAEVRRILVPSGRVYAVVPCVTHRSAIRDGLNWRHLGPPGHLWYFSVEAMKMFMPQHGFRVMFAHNFSNRPHLTVLAEKV